MDTLAEIQLGCLNSLKEWIRGPTYLLDIVFFFFFLVFWFRFVSALFIIIIFFWWTPSLILRCNFFVSHTNLFLTTLVIFDLMNVRFRNELKRVLGCDRVTDDVIKQLLLSMTSQPHFVACEWHTKHYVYHFMPFLRFYRIPVWVKELYIPYSVHLTKVSSLLYKILGMRGRASQEQCWILVITNQPVSALQPPYTWLISKLRISPRMLNRYGFDPFFRSIHGDCISLSCENQLKLFVSEALNFRAATSVPFV